MQRVLLYSTGNYIQYPVINHNRKDYEKEWDFSGGPVVRNLPMQGTQVGSLVQEDSARHRATKPTCPNYCSPHTTTREAGMPQKPLLHNRRSLCNEKPAHQNQRRSAYSNEGPALPKINTWINNLEKRMYICITESLFCTAGMNTTL